MPNQFTPISSVVDAPNSRGRKRYTVRVNDGVSKVELETVGFFGKYDLRGWLPGDILEALTDFGILGYSITGTNAGGELILELMYYFANSAGLIDASEIPMSPILGGGAEGIADGAETVQEAIALLNSVSLTGLTAENVIEVIENDDDLNDRLWIALMTRHASWDGTTLNIDFNGDGYIGGVGPPP